MQNVLNVSLSVLLMLKNDAVSVLLLFIVTLF